MELTRIINPDLNSKKVTKGCISTTRWCRKLAIRSMNLDLELVNDPKRTRQDSTVTESGKLNVAFLGHGSADTVEYIPLKKRRLWYQHLSSPPCTSSVDRKVSLSSQSQYPSPHPGESEHLVNSKFSSSQQAHSNWNIGDFYVSGEVKFEDGFDDIRNGMISEVTNDDDPNVNEDSFVEEFAAARVEASTAAIPIKETVASFEGDRFFQKDSVNVDSTDDFIVQDTSIVLSNNHHNDKNAGVVERSLTSESNRSHWDLNTLMEEWAEPYLGTFNSQINDLGSFLDDGDKFHSLSCGQLVSSDPHGIQLGTIKFDLERRILQECSGPFNAEKIYVATPTENVLELLNPAVAEIKPPTSFISTDTLHNCGCPGSDHITGTCAGEKINTSASMFVQYKKDISRTSYTELGKSSLQCGQTEKIDIVSRLSTDMLILDKPVFNADGIKSKDGENFWRTSGEDPTKCSSKLTSEDPSSDCNGSDISQDNRGPMVSVENIREPQAGYDSPIEDGELRESGVCSLGENEVESWETGHLDNGSVDKYHIDLLDKKDGNVNSGMVGKAALDAGSDKAVEQRGCDTLMIAGHSSSLKTKYSGMNQFCEHQGDINAEGYRDELDDEGLVAVEFGARQSRQKLSSHIEGPYFDFVHRKNTAFTQRRRSVHLPYSCSRAERNIGSAKSLERDSFPFPVRRKNGADVHRRVDSSVGYQDSRNSYSHSYHGQEDHGYSRPRHVITNSVSEGSALNSHDDRRSVNYSSNGMYRSLIRRKSPAERDDLIGSCRGTPPASGINHAWSQCRSGKYAHRARRDAKEEYYEGMRDNAYASSTCYFSRRDRGFSPTFGRGAHFPRPYKNSRSRSRSCSPPHACYAWRDRRSPARMFRQSQRRDFVGNSGRLKSDDNLRSFKRQKEKNSQMAGAGSGCYFEDSDDDRRKHKDRFETVGSVRHYDACGAMRQFRHDAEDLLKSRNSHDEDDYTRDTFRKDVSRSAREEKCPSKYNSDRFDDNALSSGQQELKEDTAPTVVPKNASEEKSPTKYNTDMTDTSALSYGQQELKEDATPRGVPRSPREERGPSKYNSDGINTSASLSELQDAAPKGV